MNNFLIKRVEHLLRNRGWIHRNDKDFLTLPDSKDYSPIAESGVSGELSLTRFGRLGLPKLVPPDAVGLELGVAEGYFSDILLSVGSFSRLYSIDAWADHHDTNEYLRCVALLSKFGCRSVVMRMFFDDALRHFPNEFFDFVYVDAYAHTGQQDGALLTNWYPKLKKGGIFSGHDYDKESWPETVMAVDEFSSSISKEVIVVPPVETHNLHDMYPSWYFVK